jgi:hypothetical protein
MWGASRLLAVVALMYSWMLVPASGHSDATPAALALGPGRASVLDGCQVLIGAAPGDLIEDVGVSAIVPEVGHGVSGSTLAEDGADQDIVLETLEGGIVMACKLGDDSLSTEDSMGSTEPTHASGSPPECEDDLYTTLPSKWYSTMYWLFNAGSTPSEVSVDAAEGALRDGGQNITGADNDCGVPDYVHAVQSYSGRTTRGVNITTGAGCGSDDGYNVVGWGTLPVGILGVNCNWYGGLFTFESDVRLNKAQGYRWVVTPGGSCLGKWFVEGVMTHERGHTFGLDHVSESSHGNLTMSTAINHACSGSDTSLDEERTLGSGDLAGLIDLYPA